MKRHSHTIFIFLLLLSSCQEESIPMEAPLLSETEIETLLFTREEEKLAHDVYTLAFEKYGSPIFQNIAASETQHIAAVLGVMNDFQVQDPLQGDNSLGKFNNPVLSNLYQKLSNRVDQSISEAILVGLFIEDLDILDLQMAQASTQNLELESVYSRLQCGSKNHLRSFYSQAISLQLEYKPLFLNQVAFDSIIHSANTNCQPN